MQVVAVLCANRTNHGLRASIKTQTIRHSDEGTTEESQFTGCNWKFFATASFAETAMCRQAQNDGKVFRDALKY
jgi:hypothetical protein